MCSKHDEHCRRSLGSHRHRSRWSPSLGRVCSSGGSNFRHFAGGGVEEDYETCFSGYWPLGLRLQLQQPMAKADTIASGSEISVTGSNFQFNTGTGTVTFAANGTCSTCGNYTVGGVSGTFASFFSSPNPVTFFPTAPQPGPFVLPLGPMTPHSPPGGSLVILSTTQGGETLTFVLTQESWMFGPDPSGMFTNLSVTGTGIFNLTGVDNFTPEDCGVQLHRAADPRRRARSL